MKVTEDVNFPPVKDTSESAWNESLKRMEQAEAELQKTILGISESRLEQPAVEGGSSVYNQVHGAIQHSLYHAGQIMLLKKAVNTLPRP